MKVKLLRIIALVLVFIGFGVVGLLSHEAGHLFVNNALGGTGNIFFNYTLTAGHMDWATLPENNIWMVYFGGGLFAALFMFVFFWLPARLTPGKQDVYIEGAVTSHILANLFYAPTEVILYYRGENLFEWTSIVAYIIAAILFCLLYIIKLIKWVGRSNNNNH